MVIAFIPEIINKDYDAVILKLAIVFLAILLVNSSILTDFFFGTKKAKEIGEPRTSEGYKRTVSKFVFYSATMMFAFFFDILNVFSWYLSPPLSLIPFFSLIAAGGLIFTEFKSIREKAEDKQRRKTDESFQQLAEIFKDKDVLSQIFKVLDNNKK